MILLSRRNELQGYLELLIRNFNQNTVEDLMCRNLIRYCNKYSLLCRYHTIKTHVYTKHMEPFFDKIINILKAIYSSLLRELFYKKNYHATLQF